MLDYTSYWSFSDHLDDFSPISNVNKHEIISVSVARTKREDDCFEIYRTDACGGKLIQVSDPLHLSIVHALFEQPLSTTEIAETVGKPQSTLSVHLDEMVRQSLIGFEFDRFDSRRKIYSLTSRLVAKSQESNEIGRTELRRFMDEATTSKDPFYKTLMIAMILSSESGGLDISNWMRSLGEGFAESLFRGSTSLKVEDVISELQEFYEKNSLGEVCIYTFLPLTIIIRNGDEFMYKMESMAAFSHGMFTTALTKVTGTSYRIAKSEIFGTGNNYYKFILESVK